MKTLLRTRSRTGWIGIDVGSHSVKVAQLELAGGQKQLSEAMIIPVPDPGISMAETLRSGWLARVLREELPHHRGFRGRNAACSLSMSMTEFRSLSIPPGSVKERREMISQELSESGDFSSSEFEFDFWDSYSSGGDGSTAEAPVNVLSVPVEVATELAGAVQKAGLICHVLDGGPFALARAVELMGSQNAASQPVAVLDWGHHAAHFVLIVGGQPVFSRLLKDCGVGALVAAVGRELALPPEDCHQLLSTCGVPNPQLDRSDRTELQELVDNYAGDLFDQLISELDKTLSYLRLQRTELIPTELWLVGGGGTIRNAESKLSFETGINVRLWQPPHRASVSFGLERQSLGLFAQAAALSDLGWAQ